MNQDNPAADSQSNSAKKTADDQNTDKTTSVDATSVDATSVDATSVDAGSVDQTFGDFHLSIDNGVAIVTLDMQGQGMNVLNESFNHDFLQVLEHIKTNHAIKAAVITSGKSGSFIAGADIKMLDKVTSQQAANDLALEGQAMLNQLADSDKPVVAAINGLALGGGLELALACDARIASDHPKTAVGLPEVMLGILPGGGGTQRLPHLIGVQSALDMMLTGKQVKAHKALKMGLLDEVVAEPVLIQAAAQKATSLIGHTHDDQGKKVSLIDKLKAKVMQDTQFGRNMVFDQARKQVMKRSRGNYPAPLKILQAVQYGLEHGLEKGLQREAELFGELVVSPEARQQINTYFATTELKKETFVDAKIKPRKIDRVGVLGGGLMGGGISVVSLVNAGSEVRLKDISDQGVRNAVKHVHDALQKKVKRRSMRPLAARKQLNRFSGSLDYRGFGRADLIIEAVFEKLELKQQMVKDIEALADSRGANKKIIFATNTSSIPIASIAAAAARPAQVIGMHYFSPVEKMPLLEVIEHEGTADWVTATCVDYGKKQGKTVIVVKDVPGFYVNRVLPAYMNEASKLLLEGVAVDRIDDILVQWGFPVGPFKLLDEVGIDVGTKVQPILEEAYGERMAAAGVADKLINDNRLGKKSEKGFYNYQPDDKKLTGKVVDESVYSLLGVTPDNAMNQETIIERCIYPLLNEAARCLEEEVIRSPRDGDIGAIFGFGFPPFRGGPFRYMDSLGLDTVLKKLQQYAHHGAAYEPATIIKDMAAKNKTFY